MTSSTNQNLISYEDTRGNTPIPIPFSQAVINGLASCGGLYVPEKIPQISIDNIGSLASLPYYKQASFVYQRLGVDLDPDEITNLMHQAYGDAFDTTEICPLHDLRDGRYLLELWHGPTCAFKDMALQCMPLFFSASASKLRQAHLLNHDFLILVATSGDTGSAALAGFASKENVAIAVLYPDGGVSDIQRLQMTTQPGNNVQTWAVRGNFDDCQTSVKHIFGDSVEAKRLAENYNVVLSSANSINWGRLAPQIIYYLSAYSRLVAQQAIALGDEVDVCVPTGNFGNILAAYYARCMGAPIRRLLCASNENNVLTDFIRSGTYDIAQRPFHLTPSPSMDILVSSNLERQLFELSGRDCEAVKRWMNDLNTKRAFRINDSTALALQSIFLADYVDNETSLQTIAEIFEAQHYLIDPHTAVACKVAERLSDRRPVIVASTAHWAKFGSNVYRALHGIRATDPLPSAIASLDGCALNELISTETDATIPHSITALSGKTPRFTEVIANDIDDIEHHCEAFLARWVRDRQQEH